MMTKKSSIGSALLLLLLLVLLAPGMGRAQPADAPPMGPGRGMGPGMGMGPGSDCGGGPRSWIDQLDLSPEQQIRLEELRLEHRKAQIALRGKIAAARAELEVLLLDPEASRDAVLKAGEKIADLRSRAAQQNLAHRMDVRELLTAEQRAQLVQWKSRHPERGGFGHGGGGSPGGKPRHRCGRGPRI